MHENQGNIERFSGFAAVYDAFRPTPPRILLEVLPQWAGTVRPRRVVDIASGTGLSTFLWSDAADEVIGVEPNSDMRSQAASRVGGITNVRFVDGLASATGLPDTSCDVVTISQALHWLEPDSTFAEVARILRPGGVLAAYDSDWPPVVHPEAERAYERCMARVDRLFRDRGLARQVTRWEKRGHLARIRACGHFRHVREVVLHHIEEGNADRFVGITRSQGSVAALLRAGVSEDAIGLTDLREAAERTLGDELRTWFWGYRVRLGVK